MRILKNGFWETRVKCTNSACKSVLIVEEDDLKERDGVDFKSHYFICPVCKQECNLDKKTNDRFNNYLIISFIRAIREFAK